MKSMTVDNVISEIETALNSEISKKQSAEKKINALKDRLEKMRRLKKAMDEDTVFASRITVT